MEVDGYGGGMEGGMAMSQVFPPFLNQIPLAQTARLPSPPLLQHTRTHARTGEAAVGAGADVPHVLRDGVLVRDGGRLALFQVLVHSRDHLFVVVFGSFVCLVVCEGWMHPAPGMHGNGWCMQALVRFFVRQ